AVCLAILGSALYAYTRLEPLSRRQVVISLLAGMVAIVTVLNIEEWVMGGPTTIHSLILKVIHDGAVSYHPSFWIMGSILGLSLSLLFLPLSPVYRHRRVCAFSGYLASLLLLSNAAVLLSYFYGTPLLQETIWTLPCLTATIACAA